MQLEQIIITEDGKKLINPDDGIILVGAIYKAMVDSNNKPTGGLIGHATEGSIGTRAYTNKDFIKALLIDPMELKKITDEIFDESVSMVRGHLLP